MQRWLTERRAGARWLLSGMLATIAVAAVALGLLVSTAQAAPLTILDDGGADDQPGQKDLNQMTVDPSPAVGGLAVSWKWDETAIAGANTLDACSLYDSDGDGLADAALCVIGGGDPVTYQDTVLYTCNSTRADRCAGATEVARDADAAGVADGVLDAVGAGGPYASTCAAMVSPNDPFHAGDDDFMAMCTIDLADLGMGANLINVCSYPSQQPNSDPSDCVVAPNSGFLTIVKVADIDAAFDTTFTFASQGVAANDGDVTWSVVGGGYAAQLETFAGGDDGVTIDLVEQIPDGWQLDSADCEIQSATPTPTGASVAGGIAGLLIAPGLETVCTFTNAPVPPPTTTTTMVAPTTTTMPPTTTTSAAPTTTTMPPTTTTTAAPRPNPPAACFVEGAGSTAGSGYLVSWAQDPQATAHVIYRSVNGSPDWWRGRVASPTASFSDSTATGTVVYRIVGIGSDGFRTAPTTCTTSAPPAQVEAPAACVVAPYTDSGVTNPEVSWIDNPAPADVVAHVIYRSVNGSPDWWRGRIGVPFNTFVDTPPPGDVEYRLVAIGADGSRSTPTTCDNQWDAPTGQPAVRSCNAYPITLSGNQMIDIFWNNAAGATDHIVYRSVNGGAEWWRGRVTAPEATLRDTARSGTIVYGVQAVGADGQRSAIVQCEEPVVIP